MSEFVYVVVDEVSEIRGVWRNRRQAVDAAQGDWAAVLELELQGEHGVERPGECPRCGRRDLFTTTMGPRCPLHVEDEEDGA